MTTAQTLLTIAVIAAGTMLTRFAPFLLLRGRELPCWAAYLAKTLPSAVMALLVVYCFKGVDFTSAPFGLCELTACAAVAGLYVWKRNTLVSIAGGTALYLVLIRLV